MIRIRSLCVKLYYYDRYQCPKWPWYEISTLMVETSSGGDWMVSRTRRSPRKRCLIGGSCYQMDGSCLTISVVTNPLHCCSHPRRSYCLLERKREHFPCSLDLRTIADRETTRMVVASKTPYRSNRLIWFNTNEPIFYTLFITRFSSSGSMKKEGDVTASEPFIIESNLVREHAQSTTTTTPAT